MSPNFRKNYPLEERIGVSISLSTGASDNFGPRVERRSRAPANGDPQSKFEETNSRVVQLSCRLAAEPAHYTRTILTTLKPWHPQLMRAMP